MENDLLLKTLSIPTNQALPPFRREGAWEEKPQLENRVTIPWVRGTLPVRPSPRNPLPNGGQRFRKKAASPLRRGGEGV